MYGELEMNQGEELKSWDIRFSYESHKNTKDLRKMVSTLITCCKDSTDQAKLYHNEGLDQGSKRFHPKSSKQVSDSK